MDFRWKRIFFDIFRHDATHRRHLNQTKIKIRWPRSHVRSPRSQTRYPRSRTTFARSHVCAPRSHFSQCCISRELSLTFMLHRLMISSSNKIKIERWLFPSLFTAYRPVKREIRLNINRKENQLFLSRIQSNIVETFELCRLKLRKFKGWFYGWILSDLSSMLLWYVRLIMAD